MASLRRLVGSGRGTIVAAAAILAAWLGNSAAAADHALEAPDFTRRALAGGTAVRLSDLRGKVVLLNFWASWCGPCLQEIPRLSAWQERLGASGLQIVGVSMDDAPAPVMRFLAQHPVAYPIVMGDADLGRAYGGVLGLPCSFLIDRRGRIVARIQGETDLDRLETQIKRVLSKGGN